MDVGTMVSVRPDYLFNSTYSDYSESIYHMLMASILTKVLNKMQLLDRSAIDERFFSYFEGETPTDIAKYFEVTPPTVFQWISGHRHVPWEKLKYVIDVKGVTWDWLIDGKTPEKRKGELRAWSPSFDWIGINARFLSLFSQSPQATIAALLEVTQGAVSSWSKNRRHIPWDRLKWAVLVKKVTWEWLIEGR